MKIKKLLAAVLALSLAAVSFTACSKDDETSTNDSSEAPETSAPADESPAADADDSSAEESVADDSSEAEEPADDTPSYEDEVPVPATEGYQAFLMCADEGWVFGDGSGNWNLASSGSADGLGTDAGITGDGTYIVSFSQGQAGSSITGLGIQVLNVDIDGLATAVGADSAGKDDATDGAAKKQLAIDSGIVITGVKILVDDEELVTIPDEKLLYGDIEGNGKIRLEIYNPGGGGDTSKTDSEFYVEEVATALGSAEFSKIAVEFTIDVPDDLEMPAAE